MSKQKYIIPSTDSKCFRRNDTWYRQIDKRLARKCFDAGKQILLLSSNLCFNNLWQYPCPIRKEDSYGKRDFDHIVNDYTYYNCDAERGRYVHFYIKLDDYTNINK